MDGSVTTEDTWSVAGRTFRSRLIVGTGKYKDYAQNAAAAEAAGAEIVTVALRRVNLGERGQGSLLDFVDPAKYLLLPNTAGCYTADEAVRTARLTVSTTGSDPGMVSGPAGWLGSRSTRFVPTSSLRRRLAALR